jgi:anti-sigma factor RsiW
MKHESASQKLLELAYGELPAREVRAVEAHAAGCDACRTELARIRETRALMARLPSEPAPVHGEAIVMAAAREAAAARDRRPRILPAWLWGGGLGAIAVAAVAVVSWQLAKSPPPSAMRHGGSELMGTAPAAPPPAPAPARGLVEDKAVAEVAATPEKKAAARLVAKSKEAPSLSPAPAGERPGEGGVAAAPPANVWAPPPATAAPSARASSGAAEKREQLSDAYVAPAPSREEAEPSAKAEAPAPARARSAERKLAAAGPAAPEPPHAPGKVLVRSFGSCPGERRRIVEYGWDGKVVRYVREGGLRTVEHRFDPEGRLVAAFAIERGVRRPLPLDVPGLVQDARDAGFEAPPRCAP